MEKSLAPVLTPQRAGHISLLAMIVCLWLVLFFGLTGAVLAGFVVYCASQALAQSMLRRLDSLRAQQVAVGLVALMVVGILATAGLGLMSFLGGDGPGRLMLKMSQVLSELRPHLPNWLTHSWPNSIDATGGWLGKQLQAHAATAQAWGQDVAHGLGRVVIGMFLGGVVAVSRVADAHGHTELGQALLQRLGHFASSFRQVVFAQVKIAAVNTLLTAVFLVGVLPAMGVHLPLAKTLIIITFLLGLVPVLGNLASNTAITLVALSVAPWVAGVSLAYLIVIHKLEYLLNARIVGGQIDARAWELLAAMLLMEAIFGISGIIMAPIYYAYLKRECRAAGWL